MDGERNAGAGARRRAATAVTVLALAFAAALAASGAAGAAQPHDGTQPAGTILTFAGGPGGPAKATTVPLTTGSPCGVSSTAGHLEVADQSTVRTVNVKTDWLTTPAGTGTDGPPGNGGLATAANLDTCGVVADHSGNLVVADTLNDLIEVVAHTSGTFYGQAMTAGHIYTVAGNGTPGFSGDGGPATKARLSTPGGVAVDSAGNLVIADTDNDRVRVVAASSGTFYGQAMTAGDIYTVAGSGAGFSGDGGPAAKAKLWGPDDVAVDSAGNLLIADTINNRIRVVAASSGTFYGQAMTARDIYTVAGNGAFGFSGDGGPATAATLDYPSSVAVDGAGNLILADQHNERIRVVADTNGTFYGQAMTAGHIYTVAGDGHKGFSGDGGPATKARLRHPQAAAIDGAGNLAIADTGNDRIRVVAGTSGTFYGQPMTAGHIYTVAGNGRSAFYGNGTTVARARLHFPEGLAVDGSGNTVIADRGNDRVRVVAGAAGTFYGQPMTAGHIYTIAGTFRVGFSGDGGPGSKAELNAPVAVAVDRVGNVLICDALNERIRVVAAKTGTFYSQAMTAGHIYTIAGDGVYGFSGDGGPATKAAMSGPSSVAVDGSGNVLIADEGNGRIRVVAAKTGTFYGQPMTGGDIYTVAGDGTQAELNGPEGVAVDGAGNLLIADTHNNRIRVLAAKTGTFYGQAMTAGHIYTVAGDGTQGFSGDGGPGTKAELSVPVGVAADAAGNLLIADAGNNRIRALAAKTGTFYGQAMTAGHIYTIAGSGTSGFSGDGGPATSAGIDQPQDVTALGTGGLLIAETGSSRVRKVIG